MKIKNFAIVLNCLFMMVIFLITGCSKESDESNTSVQKEKNEPAKPQVVNVARIGNSSISVDEFKDYLSQRMPYSLNKKDELVKKRLDEMVIQELLYQEALRLKTDQDPALKRRIKQMVVQKLMEEQINQKVMGRKIEEKEYQEYYNQQIEKFKRPALMRLADIFIAVPEGATPEKKVEMKKKAEAALAEAQKIKSQRSGFSHLIQKYSDTPDKYSKGDTGFFDIKGEPVGVCPKLAEAAFKLKKNGEIPDHVIESSVGFHVIMMTGKRAPVNKSIQQMKRSIERQIRNEELKKRRDDYIEGLKTKSEIIVDENVLADIQNNLAKLKRQRPNTPPRRNMPPVMKGGRRSPPMPPMRDGQ